LAAHPNINDPHPPPVDRLGIVMAAESAQKTSGSTYVKKPNNAADKLKD
jgi:hypothetical protein